MAGKVIETTDATFENEVLKASTPTLVDFWAAWCAPCRAIAPAVAELAEQYDGKVSFAKMDIDANPATPTRYEIRSIPTLLLFKDGKVLGQVIGAVPKSKLEELVKKAL
ncbi:MAG: thioredoxin [Myxococcota bacterium]